jgi:NAD(P)-dependent dehydrogenase (short-subunit alcohol dehydrogenase family)
MQGKTVLITGGNSGIGLMTAVGLARMGAQVIITARTVAKGDTAVEEIRRRSGSDDVSHVQLDLASLASIRACSETVLSMVPRLSVLINNAGVIMLRRRRTEDGFETTFGVNHLGHFAFTNHLLDRLRSSAPSRIVVVSSAAHRGARRGLDFADLNSEHGRYRAFRTYSRSKLANILFTRELARRLDGSGVTANAVHPGAVSTRLARDGDAGVLGHLGMLVARPFLLSPEQGAATSIYVASAPELECVTGAYFEKSAPVTSSKSALDMAAAAQLWSASSALTGV